MRARVAIALALPLLIGAALGEGCGSGSSGGHNEAAGGGRFTGLVIRPSRQAPPLALNSYDGRPVDISRFRGDAVLVAFLYTHCPDTCPLTVSKFRIVQQRLAARARRLRIVAVSVDPRGDTPRTVVRFLAAREMAGRMDYLLGSPSRLAQTWRDWGVGVQVTSPTPDRVAHSAQIYGVDSRGRMRVVYSPDFTPDQLVHDVPLLVST